MLWKKSNTWLDRYLIDLMNFYDSIEIDTILKPTDKDKLRKHINSIRLILNRYAPNK